MFQLFQINWPPEDYDPEDDEIAKVYTNGGKVSLSIIISAITIIVKVIIMIIRHQHLHRPTQRQDQVQRSMATIQVMMINV